MMKLPEIKMSNLNWRKIIITVLIVLCCFLLGYFVTDLIVSFLSWNLTWYIKLFRTLEMVLLFVGVYLLQIFFHELGHMVVALARRWNFISFLYLRWVLAWKEGRFCFSRLAIPGVGGQCLMMPPQEGDSLKGVILYNAGGLIANALILLLSVLGLVLAPVGTAFEWLVIGWSGIITSIFILVMNGFPFRKPALPNDGNNIRFLRKNEAASEMLLQCLRYQGWAQQGKSLNEVANGYFFDFNQRVPDLKNTIHVAALSMDVDLAMSKFDFDKAREILAYVDEHHRVLVPIMWKVFRTNMIYLHFISGEEGAPAYWDYDMDQFLYKMSKTEPSALRVLYVIAKFYDHDELKAENFYQKFNQLCEGYYLPGMVVTERKLVEFARLK